MSRTPARFRQSDIHRAIKAVVQSGADMAVVLTKTGDIQIARNPGISAVAQPPVEARPKKAF